jgi:translation initiation factor 6 (eIF-6)
VQFYKINSIALSEFRDIATLTTSNARTVIVLKKTKDFEIQKKRKSTHVHTEKLKTVCNGTEYFCLDKN